MENPLILAIPRGGVVIGHKISKILHCKLDVIISKKITPPENPEFAIGSVTHDGLLYKGPYWEKFSNSSKLESEIKIKINEVKRRLKEYRGNSDYRLDNKTIILVDDGIATGATVFVILMWLRRQKVDKIILAIPVISSNTYNEIKPYVDDIIALEIPIEFYSVSQFYQKFEQVNDEEVKILLSDSQG